MRSCKNKNDFINLIILFSCFILAMFAFSCYTSPLYPKYLGYDSAIFSLLGKGLVEGKELYTELFDHKGPVIFFITALGQLLGGRTGIFLVQCVSGLIAVAFLYFTGKMLCPEGKYKSCIECVVLFLCAGSVFLYTAENGNLTEEYSLPFISCALYFFVKYILRAQSDPRHPPLYSLVYGITLASVALLRLNNAVTICAGVLVIFVYVLLRKEYGNLLRNLLFGLLGLALVFIPTLVYFYMHSSLEEMIYATFLHNFRIAGNTGRISVLQRPKLFFILYLPMLLSLIMLVVELIKKRKVSAVDGLLGSILLMNFLCLWVANRFPHYFTIFVPVYYVFLCRYLRVNRRSVILLLAVILCAGSYLKITLDRTKAAATELYTFRDNLRYDIVAADMARIPEHERDSVIGYEIMAADYLAGDILPCYKYYTLQSTWAITTPSIVPDFISYVDENEPLWVLTAEEETATALDEILDDRYELQFRDPYVYFYRLIEPPKTQ